MRRILAARSVQLGAALVAAALLGAAVRVSAATVPYRTDAELVAISNRVVRGRVLDSVAERAPSGAIRTRTRIAVIEDFTGGAEAILIVLERGGRLPDGTIVWIPGAPQFAPGDDVVLCLERIADGYRTVSMAFSAFHVGATIGGEPQLTRFGGVTVVGGRATAAVEAARGLGEFRRAAATVTGIASRLVATEAQAAAAVATAAAPDRVQAPFTLLGGGIRWQQADSDQAIVWYRNGLTPSTIQGTDTDTQIRVALSAWTAPPTASITLAFGGTRDVAIVPPSTPADDPYCTAGNLGVGLISFGDPLNELSLGTLAIGGGCGNSSTHVINGQVFGAFTHGLVVLNDDAALAGFRTAPNITRILQHEIGHGIGLGHSDQGPGNIMHPSCCPPGMPFPPDLGPDDLAGLVFIYPVPVVPPCSYTIGPPTSSFSAAFGGRESLAVTVSRSTCTWTAVPSAPWIRIVFGAAGAGNGTITYDVGPNLANPAERSATIAVGTAVGTVVQAGDIDIGGDGIYENWADFFRLRLLTPDQSGPQDDPDGDGVSNLAEQAAGTHPMGTLRRYLAEGASNAFFDTEIALFNPGGPEALAPTVLRIQPEGGAERTWTILVPGGVRRTIPAPLLESLTTAPFSTLVESDHPLVVDRTMRWDSTGYGAHAETAVEAPATTWYLAEGSTSGDFALFYLLQNPGNVSASATVRFLRPAPQAPVDRNYTIAPHARLTIPVDNVAPELASTDVSAVITATQPIVVERAMYLSLPGQPFAAGHESAGVTAPATSWFLAEGATGAFFDLFLLIENPGAQAAAVRVDYLLPGGGTLSKDYTVAGQSRYTIYVDEEQLPAGSGLKPLASTSVAMRVTTLNAVPIIVERAMWWPQPVWYEAHNAAGTTATGTRWALAAGAVGGPTAQETYILIANTSTSAGTARVTLSLEDGTDATVSRDIALPPQSRTNVPVSSMFPEAAGKRFGTLIQSLGGTPVPIVVERAMYDSPGGVTWAAGTAAVATRLTP